MTDITQPCGSRRCEYKAYLRLLRKYGYDLLMLVYLKSLYYESVPFPATKMGAIILSDFASRKKSKKYMTGVSFIRLHRQRLCTTYASVPTFFRNI